MWTKVRRSFGQVASRQLPQRAPTLLSHVESHPHTKQAVVIVKKLVSDGSFCRKCRDVSARLHESGLDDYISYSAVVSADQTQTEGVALARHFQITSAPFFLVRNDGDERCGENDGWQAHTSFLQVKRLILDSLLAESPHLHALHQTEPHSDGVDPSSKISCVFVKKLDEHGQWCRKCEEVEKRLQEDGLSKFIGHRSVADVSRPQSEGIRLAKHFEVSTAPFFLLRDHSQGPRARWRVVNSYITLKRLLLNTKHLRRQEIEKQIATLQQELLGLQ